MARKAEVGLDYFPLNTDIASSTKVKLLIAEFGIKTWAVLVPLLCRIYKEKGYWIDWEDKDMKLLLAEELRVEVRFLDEFVSGCLRRGFFDETVFNMFGILTSDRIQETYIEAKKRSKRVELIQEFLVIPDECYINIDNVYINSLNVTLISKNVNINSQSKRKVKEKEKESESACAKAQAYAPDQLESFKKFSDWINANAPSVAKMKEPFTIDQFLRVKHEFPVEIVREILTSMHNKKSLTKDYISANLTFRKWVKYVNPKQQNNAGEQTENETNRKLRAAVDAVRKGTATG